MRDRERERERQRQRERDRERARDRDRETETERELETERETDRDRQREREGETERESGRERESKGSCKIYMWSKLLSWLILVFMAMRQQNSTQCLRNSIQRINKSFPILGVYRTTFFLNGRKVVSDYIGIDVINSGSALTGQTREFNLRVI